MLSNETQTASSFVHPQIPACVHIHLDPRHQRLSDGGTSLAGIPIISFIVFTKGVQIGFSCALFLCTYQFKGVLGIILALVPQVLFDVLALYLISASALQCSMYICYSTTNRERLDLKKLMNYLLNDIFICFLLVLAGSYLKATLGIEFIRLFNLM